MEAGFINEVAVAPANEDRCAGNKASKPEPNGNLWRKGYELVSSKLNHRVCFRGIEKNLCPKKLKIFIG
jgi:hypothetical protein